MDNKQCTRCHQVKPIDQFYKNKRYKGGYTAWCKSCLAQDRKDRESQPEAKQHKREVNQKWYESNKEQIRPKQNEYNRSKWMTDQATRDRKNRQKTESVNRRKSDPGFISKLKFWVHSSNHNRRSRIKTSRSDNPLTQEQWESICKKYDYKCLRCGEVKPLTIDHIIPLSKGGLHTASNVQPLCKSCNSKKHTQSIDYR